MMTNNYQILIEKLDGFIRKYYKNLVIRGSIYSLSSVLLLFIIITSIEHFAYLGTIARAVLFFSFILFNVFVIGKLILIPFFKTYKLGKIISNEEAARIIGTHFSEIGDKLLNILQLKKLEDNNPQTRTLIEAGINQKIELIKPISFKKAIDFRKNKKYLKYAITPMFIIGIVFLASPSIITDSTKRIIKYNTYFEKENPFKFTIVNKELKAIQNEDFILDVKVSGDEIPAEIYIETDNNRFLLQKQTNTLHQYTFKNVQKDTPFKLYAAGYTSPTFNLIVLPKPIILNFDIQLVYPAYLNKKDETISNTGDITIPAGTTATWHFTTRDTKQIMFTANGEKHEIKSSNTNYFTYAHKFITNSTYTVITQNEYVISSDSLSYAINVIPDAFPTIDVEEFRDSVLDNNLFFAGNIKDDYGFKKLAFNYTIFSQDTKKDIKSSLISINTNIVQQQFYHQFNINDLKHQPGDVIEYYFEVWDNDGVNGSKSTRSRTMTFKTLSKNEIQEKTDNKSENLKTEMEAAIKNAKSIQKSIDDLNKRMIEKKSLSWQDKQSIEDLIEKNKELQKKTDDIQKTFENKEKWENQFKEQNEEILKKQEELNKLLEKLMTDDMKKLMAELEKALDKLDKDKVKEMLDKMKLNSKDVEKEIDRSLELMKQFEFEKKLSESIEKLDSLAKDQKQLSDKAEDKKADSQKLNEEQKKLNEDFENLKKDLNDLDKKNKELEKPNKFERTDEQQKNISDQMQKSSEQLQKNSPKKASQSQKNASEQMKELSEKLKEMESEMEQESMSEDIDALRSILENLLRTSFTQEEVMLNLRKTSPKDPKYIALMQEQNKIKDDMKMIEDSLFAVSKRQVQIKSFVNTEMADLNSNLDKAVEAFVARNIQYAASQQQYVMTHVNNLALMLNESLQNMQMQKNKKSGSCNKSGSCSKPGQGSPSFKSMRQMQEALNKMLQDMKDGKQPSGKTGGNQSMNEQLARAAAQQEAIRNRLRSMAEELKKQGIGNSKELDALQQQMEQSESDIVNKMISRETIKRQQDILTKLLEHEKAEMEREMEEQRESKEAKNQKFSNPNQIFKYNNLKSKEEELLKTVPPSFKIFYKNKVNEYFYNFQE